MSPLAKEQFRVKAEEWETPGLAPALLQAHSASAFTLCTISPNFNIEKPDLEKRQNIRSNVCGGLGQHLLFNQD